MRLGIIGSTLGLITAFTFTQLAKADDGKHQGSHHEIKGAETFVAHVVLTPTDSAPGASGQLDLQGLNRNGTASAQLNIKTFGLDVGDYNVAASLKSDGSSVSIGTITVANPHSHGKGNGNNGENEGNARGNYHTSNHFVFDSVDPSDISQITISDSNNTTDLIGDFVNLAKGSHVSMKANVKVSAGDVAPNATGSAILGVAAVGTNVTGTATVAASNLPTNTLLNVTVDNQPVGTVTTGKSGTAVLKNLRNVSVQSGNQVTLTTPSGGTAATANF